MSVRTWLGSHQLGSPVYTLQPCSALCPGSHPHLGFTFSACPGFISEPLADLQRSTLPGSRGLQGMAPSGATPVPTPHLHLCLPPAIRASSPQCGGPCTPAAPLTSPTVSALPAQTCLSGRAQSKDSSSKTPLLILCTQTPPTATNTPPSSALPLGPFVALSHSSSF